MGVINMNTDKNKEVVSESTSQPQVHYYEPIKEARNGIGLTGFILALIGLFVSWIPVINYIIWFLGAIFSVIGLFKKPRGFAITGTIISFIGIIIIISVIGALAGIGAGIGAGL